MKQNEERYTTIIENEAAPLYYAKIFQHPNTGNYFISIKKNAEKDCDIPLQSVYEHDNTGLRLRDDLSPFDKLDVSVSIENYADEMIGFYNKIKSFHEKDDVSKVISFGIFGDEIVQQNIDYFKHMQPGLNANPTYQGGTPALSLLQKDNHNTPSVYTLNDILAREQTPPGSAIIRECSKAAGSFMDDRALDFIGKAENIHLYRD
ncbi:MAG: hypothetical protein ACOCZ6_03510 [Nanoarchaeota archaeon]